jgi:hypothetical protein
MIAVDSTHNMLLIAVKGGDAAATETVKALRAQMEREDSERLFLGNGDVAWTFEVPVQGAARLTFFVHGFREQVARIPWGRYDVAIRVGAEPCWDETTHPSVVCDDPSSGVEPLKQAMKLALQLLRDHKLQEGVVPGPERVDAGFVERSDAELARWLFERGAAIHSGSPDATSAQSTLEQYSRGYLETYAASLVDREVRNGGFPQLFWSSSRAFAVEAIHGLRSIGLVKAGDVLADAMKMFSKERPLFQRYIVEGVEGFVALQKETELGGFDKLFSDETSNLVDHLARFVRSRPALFFGRAEPQAD